MGDKAVVDKRIILEFADRRTLIILSILDLTFGIVSMIQTAVDWQICSLIASCLTMVMLCRIIVKYEKTIKGNVATFIISVLDIITGALSVALAVYMIRAVSVMLSALKNTKIVVQTSKALKLVEAGKPIVKFALPKLGGTFIIFITSICKRGNAMAEKKEKVAKEKKENTFLTYLKNNPKTIVGIVVAILTCGASGASVSLGMAFSGVAIPVWANCIVGLLIFGILLAVLCVSCTGAGFETPVMYALRNLIKKIGFEDALKVVEKEYAIYEQKVAEEKALKEAQLEENRKRFAESYKTAVVSGDYNGSLEDYIVEKEKEVAEQEQAQKQTALENAYKNAVVNEGYTKSFEEYCKTLK